MLYLGTSGFSYEDWVGNFYPMGVPKREWLAYYALPKPSSIEAMAEKTGDGFLFSIKANQEMTHQREDNAPVFRAFGEILEAIMATGKLGCVLAQFPYSFGFNRRNWDYLGLLKEQLPKIQKFDSATEKTFIFANNHWRGQSIGTIRQLRVMLD